MLNEWLDEWTEDVWVNVWMDVWVKVLMDVWVRVLQNNFLLAFKYAPLPWFDKRQEIVK